MKCPICRKPVKLTDPEAPFCSPRCREIDLDNWATGKYVISTPALPFGESGLGANEPGRNEDDEEE